MAGDINMIEDWAEALMPPGIWQRLMWLHPPVQHRCCTSLQTVALNDTALQLEEVNEYDSNYLY